MTDATGAIPCGQLLSDRSTLLLRQALPGNCNSDGTLQKGLFLPSSPDPDDPHQFLLMSTTHGRVKPDEAYERHINRGGQSLGTWGLTVGEALDLTYQCYEDGGIGENPPDHVSVDMTHVGRSKRERLASRLRQHALARGILYQPAPAQP